MKRLVCFFVFFTTVFASCNDSSYSLEDDFDREDLRKLLNVGETYFFLREYDLAIESFELAIYSANLNESNKDHEFKFRCLYFLFLSYFELRNPEMMGVVAQKALDLIASLHSYKNQDCISKNFIRILLCSDRPDPPDYERGGCIYEREAQDHYNRAYELVAEAVEHSMLAAASVYIPPIAVIETCKAVSCFKEAAVEYNRGIAIEKSGGGK